MKSSCNEAGSVTSHFGLRNVACMQLQCNQMAIIFFTLWPFTSLKICPVGSIKIATVGAKVCKYPNQNMSQRLLKCCESGDEISPNLVTLPEIVLLLAAADKIIFNVPLTAPFFLYFRLFNTVNSKHLLCLIFLNGPFPASFSFIYVFSTQLTVNVP